MSMKNALVIAGLLLAVLAAVLGVMAANVPIRDKHGPFHRGPS
jgi:hypothetical protein